MKALDTNILVRFLVNDDKKQARKARNIFEEAERHDQRLMVVTPVVLELFWVLSAVYEYAREEILDSLEQLLLLPVIEFEHPQRMRKMLSFGRSSSTDLSDLLIGICGQDMKSENTLTFDKGASKSRLFRLVRTQP